MRTLVLTLFLCLIDVFSGNLDAQTSAKPAADSLTLTDDEKLIGHLVRSNGDNVTFHSDMVGDLTFDWKKVKELHANGQYAVIPKNANLVRSAPSAPTGTLSVEQQQITVSGAGPTVKVPVASTDHVIEESTYQNDVMRNPGFFSHWRGAVTLGASLVSGTQSSRTFTESVSLFRDTPPEDWLQRRDRTSVEFMTSYGDLMQPDTPTVKTSIFHVGAERDEFLSPSFFAFGQMRFDHNFSQGLHLAQGYSGGAGWSAIHRANQELDLRAGLSYVKQQFQTSIDDDDLVSSVFGEKYRRNLKRGAVLTEEISINPAWNLPRAFMATGTATLTMPVYKRLTFTTGATESYLGDPPVGFRKSSFQILTGLTYILP